MTEEMLISRLFELRDMKYREFNIRLIPTVRPETVIGVRTPELRKLAAELGKDPFADEFIKTLPHRYYEENNIHGALIGGIKDFSRAVHEVERFLPYIDNWATCDTLSPKVFKKHLTELLVKIRQWIESEHTYIVRFGIGMLMSHYLDGAFAPEYPELVAGVKSDEYYVNMMRAWYFATALAKQYDTVVRYLEERRLDTWTHNKAIQKAVESFRVPPERKEYLKTLKIK